MLALETKTDSKQTPCQPFNSHIDIHHSYFLSIHMSSINFALSQHASSALAVQGKKQPNSNALYQYITICVRVSTTIPCDLKSTGCKHGCKLNQPCSHQFETHPPKSPTTIIPVCFSTKKMAAKNNSFPHPTPYTKIASNTPPQPHHQTPYNITLHSNPITRHLTTLINKNTPPCFTPIFAHKIAYIIAKNEVPSNDNSAVTREYSVLKILCMEDVKTDVLFLNLRSAFEKSSLF